jgi:hypothetical protein
MKIEKALETSKITKYLTPKIFDEDALSLSASYYKISIEVPKKYDETEIEYMEIKNDDKKYVMVVNQTIMHDDGDEYIGLCITTYKDVNKFLETIKNQIISARSFMNRFVYFIDTTTHKWHIFSTPKSMLDASDREW